MKMVLTIFLSNWWVWPWRSKSFSTELLDCDYQSVNVGHLHLYFLPSFKKSQWCNVRRGDSYSCTISCLVFPSKEARNEFPPSPVGAAYHVLTAWQGLKLKLSCHPGLTHKHMRSTSGSRYKSSSYSVQDISNELHRKSGYVKAQPAF